MGAIHPRREALMSDDLVHKTVEQLDMTQRDVLRLYKAFVKFDADKSGDISVAEFFLALSEAPSLFGERLFQLIDMDSDSRISFPEFVRVVGTYCMFGTLDILKFCFFVFDEHKRGYLEFGEVETLVAILHEHQQSTNVNIAIKQLDLNQDGRINFFEFKQMNIKYPMLLRPAFRLQEKLCMQTLGVKWFLNKRYKLQEERKRISEADKNKFRTEINRVEKEKKSLLIKKMGLVRYYLSPFQRQNELKKIMAMDTKGMLQVNTGNQQALSSDMVNQALGITDDSILGPSALPSDASDEEKKRAHKVHKAATKKKHKHETNHRSDSATRQRRADKRKQDTIDRYKNVVQSGTHHVNVTRVQEAFDRKKDQGRARRKGGHGGVSPAG